MNLSKHFTLEEFIFSESAIRLKINNKPPASVIPYLQATAQGLELVRELIKAPIIISSGYRSPKVNQSVGGAKTSQHILGQAADIKAPQFGTPAQLVRAIVDSGIEYDQCILEFGAWCHISFNRNPRKQALIIDHSGTRSFA